MKRLGLNIVFVLLLMSCSLDFRSNEKIESLIDSNRDKRLFLSFWLGMDERDFKRVLQYENLHENLNDGKFEFLYSNELMIPFEVSKFGDAIDLTYSDEYYDYWEGSGQQLPKLGLVEGLHYESIIRELIKMFNEKYLLLKSDRKVESSGFGYSDYYTYNYVWKAKMNNDKFKVIMLSTYHSYYSGKQGESFQRDMKKKRDELASCRISIIYRSFDDYQKMFHEGEKSDSMKNESEAQQKQRDLKVLEDNRSKL